MGISLQNIMGLPLQVSLAGAVSASQKISLPQSKNFLLTSSTLSIFVKRVYANSILL